MDSKRILIVEDEALVADMLASILEDLGFTVVGPLGTVAAAIALAESDAKMDAAILDVNLRGERVDLVAEALRGRHVSLIFATGYGHHVADLAQGAPILTKPYTKQHIASALGAVL